MKVTILLYINALDFVRLHSFSIVHVMSSIEQCERDQVCPNETVLLECFTEGPNLVWDLPDGKQQLYNAHDNTLNFGVLVNYGPISVWLTNSTTKGFLSRMVISYSETLDSAIIGCHGSDNATHSDFHYILASGMTLNKI